MTDDGLNNLRLTHGGDSASQARWRADRGAADDVARENRLAALQTRCGGGLHPSDPLWVLAARTRLELEGSILPFDARLKLLTLATRLGVRQFDATMVIALVQDEARRREPPETLARKLASLARSDADSNDSHRAAAGPRLLAAMACAVIATVFLIWWLLGR